MIAAQPGFDASVAMPATDAEILRRLYLDLAGVIPTSTEARDYLDDASPDKRQRLIDRLLSGPHYATNMQRTFDVLLMQRRRHRHVRPTDWQAYLRDAFAANKPWNEVVTEILSADGTPERNRGASRFYLDREAAVPELVRDIGSIFLGRNLRCAQCHDHPIVTDYTQAEYHGLAAFVDRTRLFKAPGSGEMILAEKADGETTFTSAFTQERGTTGPRLPGSEALKEPHFDEGQGYVVAPAEGVRPVPRYSRRAQLAGQLVTHPGFRRSLANRLWAMMMGRGLVEPLDSDHSANPPSHPELLVLLGDELAAGNYDLRSFLRHVALTDTYQRGTRLAGRVAGMETPPPARFAVADVRPLSPEKLAWSWLTATGFDAALRAADVEKADERLAREADRVIKVFVTSRPGEADASDATVGQALLLMHGVLHEWLSPRPGNLVHRLSALSGDALADELYLSVFARRPNDQERRLLHEFLSEAGDDRDSALADFAWALLVSPEFRFIY